jgi:hypothetical protein
MIWEHFQADLRREPLRWSQNVVLLRENGDLRALSSRFAMGTAQTLPERRFSKGKR